MIKAAIFYAGIIAATASLAQAEPLNPEGIWRLSDGKVTVKVVHCNGNNICANIVALAHPVLPDGSPLFDVMNPNHALRGRRVMGLPVIQGMVPTGDNTWKGQIYNADDGGTYRAFATINGTNLQVKGCWIVFCKDMNFTKLK